MECCIKNDDFNANIKVAAAASAVKSAIDKSAGEPVATVVVSATASFEGDIYQHGQTLFRGAFTVSMAPKMYMDADDICVDSIVQVAGTIKVTWHVQVPSSVAIEAASLVLSVIPEVKAMTAKLSAPVVAVGPLTTLTKMKVRVRIGRKGARNNPPYDFNVKPTQTVEALIKLITNSKVCPQR